MLLWSFLTVCYPYCFLFRLKSIRLLAHNPILVDFVTHKWCTQEKFMLKYFKRLTLSHSLQFSYISFCNRTIFKNAFEIKTHGFCSRYFFIRSIKFNVSHAISSGSTKSWTPVNVGFHSIFSHRFDFSAFLWARISDWFSTIIKNKQSHKFHWIYGFT